MKYGYAFLAGSTCLLALAHISPASAQAATDPAVPGDRAAADTAAASNSVSAAIGDIVVTARRRAESQQNVPISITALGADQLERQNLRSTEDLRTAIPGLNIGGLRRDDDRIYVRGQGPGIQTAGLNNFTGVANYFAEVPTTGGGPGVFYDLSSVQVLKGPQGTLFGRNTTGGAILFEPQRPTWNNNGYAQISVGNHDFKQFDGVINVAPVPDILALRFATQISRRQGFTQSIITGQHLDGRDYEAFRGSLLFTPSSRLENLTIVDYRSKDNSGGSEIIQAVNAAAPLGSVAVPAALAPLLGIPAGTNVSIPLRVGGVVPLSCLSAALPGCPAGGAFGGFQAAYNGGNFANPANGGFALLAPSTQINQLLATQAAIGPRKTQVADILRSKQLDWGVTNKTTFELTDDITLKNIIAYRVSRKNESSDYDGTPLNFLNSIFVTNEPWAIGTEQFSEEFQIQGKIPSLNLEYIAGFYHEHAKPGFAEQIVGNTLGTVSIRQYDFRDTSDALYGHLDWNPLSLLGISAGVRQTWDRRRASLSLVSASGACSQTNPADGKVTCPIGYPATFRALTYDATLNLHPMPHMLVYGGFRHGYKSGGFNLPAPTAPAPLPPTAYQTFQPEKVDSIEIGMKADLDLGVPVRIDAAAFHDRYRDIQVQQSILYLNAMGVPTTTSVVLNNVNAINQGFELSGTIVPVRPLSISGFVSYLDSHPTNSVPNAVIEGRQFPNQPKWKYGVSGVLTVPVPEDYGDVTLSADWSWQGRYNVQYIVGLVPSEPSYGVLNARIEWSNVMSRGIDLAVFGTNMLDKTYVLGGYPVDSLGLNSAIFGEPRMYGASIKVHFGER